MSPQVHFIHGLWIKSAQQRQQNARFYYKRVECNIANYDTQRNLAVFFSQKFRLKA